jgi:hypothetical protein
MAAPATAADREHRQSSSDEVKLRCGVSWEWEKKPVRVKPNRFAPLYPSGVTSSAHGLGQSMGLPGGRL